MGMSGTTYNARRNEITKAYYDFLTGEVNRGTIKCDTLYKQKMQDGNYAYFKH